MEVFQLLFLWLDMMVMNNFSINLQLLCQISCTTSFPYYPYFAPQIMLFLLSPRSYLLLG